MVNIATAQVTLGDIRFNVILGGFGMFLLGIKFLGDGFKDAAGPKIRDYIEKYTGNIFSAIIVGTIITALMQSSTAATVISISLVRAGLMKLEQAIGISVGANLGTTVTALMTGLDIEELGFYFAFAGAMLLMFAKRSIWQDIGKIVFGFGIVFVGLQLMSDQLILLSDLPEFEQFMVYMSQNPWLALLAGTLATAVINSSMAVIVLVQTIYGAGGMSMIAASAFVFGSNVGTTLTAVLASVGGSVSTRRAGWFHALYNVLGAVVMMPFITQYSNFIIWLNDIFQGTPEMAVGINHFVFNFVWVVGIIPFIPLCIRILKIIIPGEDRIKEREKIEPLDYNLIESYPEGALALAKRAIDNMSDLVLESLQTSRNYLQSRDEEDYDVIMQLEEMINDIDFQTTKYLLAIANSNNNSMSLAEDFSIGLETVKNLERIADLTTNTAEYFQTIFDNRESFSQEALDDLDTMYALVIDMLERSIYMFVKEDVSGYEKLAQDEEYLDLIDHKYREKHFRRMADGICDTKYASSLYVDLLSILERIGDHAANIADYAHGGLLRVGTQVKES
ncbi:Na/Pi cotransporter family protein [Erysipelothrix sp. HDW6A]|uniref:Na/Pi cotransporter family protein n=1 Tax=Erysipelothrix sp. HDW6A TaxID=2714928 RepID=UPI00140AEE54|nr:Na/Pi cotransporter family protein [Erysipelothrix sp. HDW6A]QIK57261.1 Na/Pi cotransporter family protein [Erysipelothrix sp. HDW6A]